MKPLIIGMLCLYTTAGLSQNCKFTLTGSVVDSHDGDPLEGAVITGFSEGQVFYTDLDGRFSIPNLCEGTLGLQIAHPECKTQVFTLEITGDRSRTFRLEHHLESLNEVIITGKSYQTQSESILNNEIQRDQIERYTSGSLGDVLKTVSGVSSLNTGNTIVKPVINGLHSSRITIVNNGVVMQDQEWGAEHAPSIDVNTAGNITVLKGASALQYTGSAIGGVVVAQPQRVVLKDSIYGQTLLSGATNGRGGSISSSLVLGTEKGWFAEIQGTLKRFGDFEAPDYVLSNTGVYERDIMVRGGINKLHYGVEASYSYFRTEIGILRASHLGGAADQVRAIESDRPLIIEPFTYEIDVPRQDVTHHTGRISYFQRLKDIGKLTVQYDLQINERFEFDVRRGGRSDRPAVDLLLTTHHLHAGLETRLDDLTSLNVGLEGRYQTNEADPSTGVRRLIPDYDQYDFALFAIADRRLSDQWVVEAGIRYDYRYMDVLKFYRKSFWEQRGYDEEFPELVIEDFGNQVLTNPQPEFSNFSATAGANYSFGDSYVLFANYSLAMRAPNASELYSEGLHHSASRIELGDLRFDSEIANRINITLQKQSGRFRFSVNPFLNLIDDYILIEPTEVQQTIRGNFQVWEYRQTNAFLVGFDLDAQFDISEAFAYSGQFSFIKGYDRTLDLPLINMPPVNTLNELIWTHPQFHDLRISLQSQYVFEQNEFPDNNFDVFIPETGENVEVDVSTPPPAYHLMHLSGDATFRLNDQSNLNVGLTINNLFDTSYRDYLNRLRYYADDLGRNIILNLKLNY
ncbi:TonB-dependent receptor [Aureitalea marina]|uniref:TonB-dependent receptor n=1 Tax=Aureitalea marina TaxID=930804 RepID=A0A2S7KPD7_9FLAO|nr:TonB-dependent receptor [Aureitalea marina]PQB04481.1 TonB-dependent receptor [Aureitalea marina]